MSKDFRRTPFPRYPKKPHGASGQARIKIAGRHVYLGRWGSQESYVEHARLAAEHSRRVAQNEPPVPVCKDRLTVCEVADRWLLSAEKQFGKDHHEVREIGRVILVMTRIHGRTNAAAFGANELEEIRDSMIDGSWRTEKELADLRKQKRHAGWCRSQINKQVTRIRRVWRWAEKRGLVPRGSWEHLRTLEPLGAHVPGVRQKPKRKAVDWDRVSAAMEHTPAVVAAMLELQWFTGMRPSELVKIQTSLIDRDGPEGCWLYRIEHDKNDWREGRETPAPVVLGPESQRILAPWIDATKRRKEDWIFPPAKRGKRRIYTVAAYARAISRACELAKIERFTPYQVRHARKREVTRVAGLDGARAILRQSSLETTAQYSREIDLDLAAKIASKCG